MLFSFFVSAFCVAAPVLTMNQTYSVKPEWKDPLPAFIPLGESRLETRVDLESYSGGDSDPGVRTLTKQKFHFKEPKGDSQEVIFESFETSSKVKVAMLPKPMENRSDFSPHVSNKSLTLHWKEGQVSQIDGLEKMKSQLNSEIRDPLMKFAINQVFSEEVFKRTFTALAQNSVCVDGVKGKNPGDKWTGMRKLGDLTYECFFEGWAEAKGSRAAVIKVTIPAQKQTVNGQRSEVLGGGSLVWIPASKESLLKLSNTIYLEPQGNVPASNRSVVINSGHHQPLK